MPQSDQTVEDIVAVYVRPEAWGLWIGGAMMREAMVRLGNGGSVEVALWVIQGIAGLSASTSGSDSGRMGRSVSGRCTANPRRLCGSVGSSKGPCNVSNVHL